LISTELKLKELLLAYIFTDLPARLQLF
jgi:hypothetical protein